MFSNLTSSVEKPLQVVLECRDKLQGETSREDFHHPKDIKDFKDTDYMLATSALFNENSVCQLQVSTVTICHHMSPYMSYVTICHYCRSRPRASSPTRRSWSRLWAPKWSSRLSRLELQGGPVGFRLGWDGFVSSLSAPRLCLCKWKSCKVGAAGLNRYLFILHGGTLPGTRFTRIHPTHIVI